MNQGLPAHGWLGLWLAAVLGCSVPDGFSSVPVQLRISQTGSFVSGKLKADVQFIDISMIRGVEYSLDGAKLQSLLAPPFELEVDTRQWSDGRHVLRAEVDAETGLGSSELTVDVDNQPPSLVIRAPLDGTSWDVVREKAIALVTAEDASGDAAVLFFLDDQALASFDKPPYQHTFLLQSLFSTGDPNRSHSFRVEAKSPGGRVTSQAVTFRVIRRILWTYPAKSALVGSAEVLSDKLVVATAKGAIIGISTSGKAAFQFQADHELAAGVSVQAQANPPAVVFGDTQGLVYRLDASGKQISKRSLGNAPGMVSAPITAPPSPGSPGSAWHVPLFDGRVYQTSADLSTQALVLERMISLRLPVVGGLAIYDDGAVVSCQNPAQKYEAPRKDFWTAGTLSGSAVLVGGKDGNLYGFAPNNPGQPTVLAALGAAISTRPAVAKDGSLFVATGDGTLHHLDASGKPLWKIEKPGFTWVEPALGSDTVYTVTTSGEVAAYPLDARGAATQPSWTLSLGKPVLNRPTLVNNALLVTTAEPEAGTVIALETR